MCTWKIHSTVYYIKLDGVSLYTTKLAKINTIGEPRVGSRGGSAHRTASPGKIEAQIPGSEIPAISRESSRIGSQNSPVFSLDWPGCWLGKANPGCETRGGSSRIGLAGYGAANSTERRRVHGGAHSNNRTILRQPIRRMRSCVDSK